MSKKLVVHCKNEPFDVYIGRPSPYGNPFSHKPGTLAEFKVVSREEAIEKYEDWIRSQPALVRKIKDELKNKVLGCWCVPLPCHGEVIAKIANEE